MWFLKFRLEQSFYLIYLFIIEDLFSIQISTDSFILLSTILALKPDS